MWDLFSIRKLRQPIRRKPFRKQRLAIEEFEARLMPTGGGLDFSNGFANAAGLLAFNGSTILSGTRLELTNGGQDQDASAFSTSRVDIGKFNTQFTFQLSNAKADGFTFTIEGVSPTAIGQSGGGLGYGSALSGQSGGIGHSVAIKFDLYSNQGEGWNSTGLYTNGAAPTSLNSTDIGFTGMDLHSGDVFSVTMTYDGTTLAVNLTDTVTKKTGTFNYTVDIPSLIGGSTAFVGFTGGTGGLSAVQDILTWKFTPTTVQPPVAPTNLSASAAAGAVNLAWTDNSDNETGFKIERKTDVNGIYSQVALVDANVTNFADVGLSNGTQYFYRVRATNSGGDSSYTNEANATTPTPPVAPTNAQMTLVSQTEIDLTWTDNANNEDGYRIRRATAGGGFTIIATLAAGTTSYQDRGLTPSTLEDYHIEAFNTVGISPFVDISATTLAVPAPTSLVAKGADGAVDLAWTGSAVATSYDVYRATSSLGEGATPIATGLVGTSFHDSGLVNGTTYYYQLTAVESGSQSIKSNEAFATPQVPAPGTPAGLSASAGDTQATLTWSVVSGATSYDIYRSTSKGGEGATPYQTNITSALFTDTGLTDGTTYYYEISALNAGGQSPLSSEVSATPQVPAPGAPASVSTNHGDGQVVLSWSSSSGASSYKIYRSTAPGAEGSTPYLSGWTSTAFTDTGVTNGVTYYYEISAVNAGGQSPLSGEVSATPQVPAPGAPTGLSASAGDQQVLLTWSVASGATSYDVYRSTAQGGEGATPYQTNVASASFTDSGLMDGTTYYYEVSALNAGGESTPTSEVSATPQVPAPGAPASVSANHGDGQVVVSWSASPGATSYNVFRSTTSGSEGKTPWVFGLTSTSFTDSGLVNGTTYYYEVSAVNPGGQSPLSSEVSATPQVPAPGAPSSVAITAGDGQVSLFWTAASGATSYDVYRSTTQGGEGATPLQTNVSLTSFTDSGLTDGTTYYYEISAVNAGGESPLSSEVSATPQVPAPGTPVNVAGKPGDGQVVFSWSASVGAVSYNVYRSTTSGAEGSVPYVAGWTSTSFTDSGLTDGTTYYYEVSAVNAGGESALSSEVSATPQVPAPGAPSGVAASAGDQQVALTWAPSSGATGYDIFRSTTQGGEGPTPFLTNVISTSFTDSGLADGTTYYYEVSAVNAGGESALSSEVSATLQVPAPGAPTGLSVNGGNGLVALSWAATSTASSYNIYRSTTPGGEGSAAYLAGWTSTFFTDLGVANGVTYYYEVSAVNAGGQSALSSEVSATPQVPAPGAPASVAAKAGNGQVALSWPASSGAGSYNIYRSTTPGAEGSVPYLTGLTSTSFTDTGVTNGVTYYYEVSAVNAGGESPLSSEISATPQVPAPVAPSSLSAVAGDQQVALTWSATSGAASYDIYRSTSKGGEGSTPYQTNVTSTSFTDTGLADGATYYYEVSAVNTGGQSPLSSEVSATPQVPAPGTPTGLSAFAGDTQVVLNWSAASGATSYDIYRSTTKGGEGAAPYQTNVKSNSFTDTGLTNGITYYYEVRAVNAGGQSALSGEAAATPNSSSLFSAHINFTSDASNVPTGYMDDVGLAYGSRGNGLFFGWNIDNTAAARDRDEPYSPDELHDTLIHMQKPEDPNASWKIAVPNGTYSVHLTAGDPDFIDSYYKMSVNGVVAINSGPDWNHRWFENTITVQVTNGFIVLNNARGAWNNKIDEIDIKELSGFSAPSSPNVGPIGSSHGFGGAKGLNFIEAAERLVSALELAEGHRNEVGSFFTNSAAHFEKFWTQFAFHHLNQGVPGTAFTLQGIRHSLFGEIGEGLRYQFGDADQEDMGTSLDVKFDMSHNQDDRAN
ncbi:MAG: fibronectin type III domain-containing protein [Gemmataceae bacterium]